MLPRHIPVGPAPVSVQLDGGAGRVTWWAFRETSGTTPAAFRLWDGSNNGGRLLLPVNLNASESVSDSAGPYALPYDTGLYLEVLSGAFEGSVQVIDLHEHRRDYRPDFLVGELDINVFPPQGNP